MGKEEINAFLKPTTGKLDLRGAYTVLKRQFCQASARAPNPSQSDMAKFKGEYSAL